MGKTGLPVWEHTGKDSPCQKEVFAMKAFQIPSKPSTTSKSIRFSNDLIQGVETAIRGRNCNFSMFVVEAVRASLERQETGDLGKKRRMIKELSF